MYTESSVDSVEKWTAYPYNNPVHGSCSDSSPVHGFPPNSGCGSSHARMRTPSPHVTEQPCHACHELH
ncbi:hypothetical protein DPMN_052310 [Dreissena polymorpha]|uniref:Uncharacterized protein n=1 Tax=Dreissena polymorpha TaxID=45954 RepID=A0A9D4CL97_DREPO|nr:hypothetical protein DPMN_052310 [Dreissena polymorpha]